MAEFQDERYREVSPPQSNYAWRKSSWSFSEANCVEVACAGERVFVHDSKAVAHGGPHLKFGATEWESFIESIKGGKVVLHRISGVCTGLPLVGAALRITDAYISPG